MKQTKSTSLALPAEDQKKLWIANISAGLLHFVQGLLMLKLSSEFALPITSAFVQFNVATQKLEPVLKTVTTLQIGPLVAAFLFLSAAAHLILMLPSMRSWYYRNLSRGINIARWVEYSLSSSLMIVVIAMLVGVYDGVSLLLLFFLNATMILFGWMMELHNQTTTKTNWTAFIFGCVAGIVPWIAIAIYLVAAGSDAGKVPTFVYWIYFSLFLFFNVFAINQLLQYKKVGPWQRYLYGEYAYIVLSLVAKSLLAWQVWAGTLRPV